jgi:hypothetical protein
MRSLVFASRARMVALGLAGSIVLGAVIAACSDMLGGGVSRPAVVSLGISQNGTLASLSAGSTTMAQIVITNDGHTIDLQSADVVFSEVTFERAGVDAGDDDDSDSDSDSDHAGNETFRAGATTVALPLEGGTITPFTGTLPVGTYRGVEMDADFIRLKGTYDGQAFDVTVPINAELELAFDPPLDVTSSSTPLNVSVNIDPSKWFIDAAGNTIDPRTLSTNAEARAIFRNNVRASFRAFEDEDADHDESDSDSDEDSDDDGD